MNEGTNVTDFSTPCQEVIEMFTSIMEEKDTYTAGHSQRVACYSQKIAQEMGLYEEQQIAIYQASLLHDIGKILTPESILLKPKKFNRSEYSIIKNHAIDGEKIVNSISSFKDFAKIIRHHHERFDGDGYPDGLAKYDIPLLSRIMSIADTFDAITTNRVYKMKKNIPQAIEEIQKCNGTQFDPKIVQSAVIVFKSLEELPIFSSLPKNSIQEERFAYFFKDALTNAYSGVYLNYFLHNNQERHKFKFCFLLQIHHMHAYNKNFGWKAGDEVLIEMVLRIKILFNSSFIFRLFGDDFVILSHTPINVDKKEVIYKMCSGFDGIKVSLCDLNIDDDRMLTWENFEKYLTS